MNIKKMTIGLLAVLLTVPAFAQTQQDSIRNNFIKRKAPSVTVKQAKLAHALQMAVLMALFSNEGFKKETKSPYVKSLYKKDSLPTCVYCGEQFNPALHEHCSATGNTGLHSASAPQNGNEGSAAPASVCPKCHQTLSIDERFHGVPHNCPADTADSLPTCVYCGEKFNPFHHEHCDATGNISLAVAPRDMSGKTGFAKRLLCRKTKGVRRIVKSEIFFSATEVAVQKKFPEKLRLALWCTDIRVEIKRYAGQWL